MEIRCFEDMDLLATETESPLEDLEQDNYHRLIEDPGSNPDDPDRGLGLRGLLSGATSVLESLAPRVEAELRKDARNKEVHARVTPEAKKGSYLLEIRCVPDADELGVPVTEDLIMKLRASADKVERA